MPSDPYTIRIFVSDGDPEGIRIIDRMNWPGLGLVFPREKWPQIKTRSDFGGPGVYILVGPSGLVGPSDEDELQIYVGEGDGVGDRVENHFKNKVFWNWGIAFFSTNRSLNKAHVQWLEYALIKKASEVKRYHLDNGNVPQAPALTEGEKADCQGFLKEILQILPLVGLRAFEFAPAVATPKASFSGTSATPSPQGTDYDTIVVPAKEEGFQKVFLGEHQWYAVRISGGMIPKIKWIAAYQTQPVSAVTHVAPVERIEPYGEGGKYRLIFSEPAKPIVPIIPFGDAAQATMQGPRYTSYKKLSTAKKLSELVGKTF